MRGVRVTLSIAILLCAAPVDAGAAKPDFIKAVVDRTPFSPMPGVPPATDGEQSAETVALLQSMSRVPIRVRRFSDASPRSR